MKTIDEKTIFLNWNKNVKIIEIKMKLTKNRYWKTLLNKIIRGDNQIITKTSRRCVFLCKNKSTLFGLQKVNAFKENEDYLQQNSTTQMLLQCILWTTVSWT